MMIQQYRHNPSLHVPVARAIPVANSDRQRLTLIRLICTTMLGVALLTGSATYTRAAVSETETLSETPDKPASDVTKLDTEERVVPDYLDDRSTPQKLIESYYNAINRKEYARAYSYYAEGAAEPDFNKYREGYKNTKSVTIKLGSTEPDPGAGQIYWTLPLAIEANDNDGKNVVYTGCYTISMSNPEMQGVPPFSPMTIKAGTLSQSPKNLQESVPEECEAP